MREERSQKSSEATFWKIILIAILWNFPFLWMREAMAGKNFVNLNRNMAEFCDEIETKWFLNLFENQPEMQICEVSPFCDCMVTLLISRVGDASRTWREYLGRMITIDLSAVFEIEQLEKNANPTLLRMTEKSKQFRG
jgi:hypothetical protein